MEINKTQVKELYPGIFIKKKLLNLQQQLTYVFDLDVQDLNVIDFEADFQGSQNITIKGVGKEVYTIIKTVQPRSAANIANIQLHQGWKLKTKFRFLRRPIPKEKQLAYIRPENQYIQNERKTVQVIFKKQEVNLMPLQDIMSKLQKTKLKFVDSNFPPQESSIFGESDKSIIDDTVNHWRRPSQFFDQKNHFLFNRISHKNLILGKILDYSFHSVVSALSLKHQVLIERLFFNHKNINQFGIYRLKLCKNGQWQTVTIDDYLPCEPLAKPKYASSNLDQIWIHLLQKAYAKVHKRYLALHQLQISNVFNDLTGCPTIIVNLQNTQNVNKLLIQNFEMNNIVVLYDIEQKQFEEDEFIPLRNYAYPIIDYEEEKKKITYKFISHNHLTDYLEEEELTKKFKYACICQVQNWQELRIKGKFVAVQTGTEKESRPIVLSRWYYQVEMHEASQLFICIHQQDLLVGNNSLYKKYKYISLLIFKKGEKSKLLPLEFKRFAHNRQYQVNLLLKPGIYLIVPIMNSQITKIKSPSEKDLINDVFRKLDLLMRRQLKYADLQAFFKVVGQPFDQSRFNELLQTYTSQRKGLGLQAFTKMWKKNEVYWKDQIVNHYDLQLLFLLSIHSKQQINVLIKSNIGTQLNNRAHCEMINKYGQQLEISQNYQKYVIVKLLKCKSQIIEYMVQNKYERKVQITLDCSSSSQYIFEPRSGIVQCTLDSGQKKYIMKLIPHEKSDRQIKKENIKIKVFQ